MVNAGVPYLQRHTVVEANGSKEVESVCLAPIALDGHVDRIRKTEIQIDALVVGFGLSPSVELTRMMRCEHRFDRFLGGWVPVRSNELETTQPNVFSVGDGAGIGGVEIAISEAELAALIIAQRVNGTSDLIAAIRRARQRLTRLNKFRFGLSHTFEGPESYLDLISPETIVCRCEELTAGEVIAALRRHQGDLGQVKYVTRISMGRCQGRNCLRTLADLGAKGERAGIDETLLPRMRPPARPISIATLLDEPIEPVQPPEVRTP
jgi:NADPH-dependent 2,4-dienoyl-CoA reductase/sulfur reductase-like enzyme